MNEFNLKLFMFGYFVGAMVAVLVCVIFFNMDKDILCADDVVVDESNSSLFEVFDNETLIELTSERHDPKEIFDIVQGVDD